MAAPTFVNAVFLKNHGARITYRGAHGLEIRFEPIRGAVTLREAGALVGRSWSTMRRLVEQGQLEADRRAGRWMIPVKECLRLVAGSKRGRR